MTDSQKSEIKRLRATGLSYHEIGMKMNLTENKVRGYLRYWAERGVAVPKPDGKKEPFDLVKYLGKVHSLPEICQAACSSERIVKAMIDDAAEQGWGIIEDDGLYVINKVPGAPSQTIEIPWNGDKHVRFGMVSDTHLCSKSQQLTHLNAMYDIFAREGIKKTYHDGDIVDGDDVYPGHKFEVFKFGADEQARYAIDNYPQRQGLETDFITGNHDLKYFSKFGFDIGKAIAEKRPDMNYLGQYYARAKLTPNCILQMEHPLGKPAYAISYKTQRKIDNIRGGDKPNILTEGHYHYSDYFFRRNVHAVCCPSFQGPTTFSRRLGLENDNGGWIFELEVDEAGYINEFTPRFFPFYKLIEGDY